MHIGKNVVSADEPETAGSTAGPRRSHICERTRYRHYRTTCAAERCKSIISGRLHRQHLRHGLHCLYHHIFPRLRQPRLYPKPVFIVTFKAQEREHLSHTVEVCVPVRPPSRPSPSSIPHLNRNRNWPPLLRNPLYSARSFTMSTDIAFSNYSCRLRVYVGP